MSAKTQKELLAQIEQLRTEKEETRAALQATVEYINLVNQKFAEIYVHAAKISAPVVRTEDLN